LLLTKMVTMGASMPLVREVFSSTVLANAHSSSSGTSASYSSKILTSSLAPKSCRVRDAGNALRRCVTLSTRAAPKCAVSPRIAWGSDLLMVITIGGKKRWNRDLGYKLSCAHCFKEWCPGIDFPDGFRGIAWRYCDPELKSYVTS